MTRAYTVYWSDGSTTGSHVVWAASAMQAKCMFYLEFKLRAIINITY